MNSSGTILIVEDDETDVFLLKRMLDKAKVLQQVFVAPDGVQAIDFLKQANDPPHPDKAPTPRLIVLDLKLPLKSGLEVLQWIREQPVIKRVPVIVFSSSLARSDVNTAHDYGANGYFLKTGAPEQMLALVTLWRDCWLNHSVAPDLAQ